MPCTLSYRSTWYQIHLLNGNILSRQLTLYNRCCLTGENKDGGLVVPRAREIMEGETIPTLKMVINKGQAYISASYPTHWMATPFKVLKMGAKFCGAWALVLPHKNNQGIGMTPVVICFLIKLGCRRDGATKDTAAWQPAEQSGGHHRSEVSMCRQWVLLWKQVKQYLDVVGYSP